jgi:FKBP-type peptidyl-prolyl cis-trans isomerase FkpA
MNRFTAAAILSLSIVAATPSLADSASNLKSGEAFLAANAKKPKVITTKSGLEYMVLRDGKGARPTAASTVRVHYKGYFKSGKVFDQSYGGDPIEFPLSGVISGWTEGVGLMKVGAKYRFWIHPKLAYGSQDKDPIPGNSMLIFDVELLGVQG